MFDATFLWPSAVSPAGHYYWPWRPWGQGHPRAIRGGGWWVVGGFSGSWSLAATTLAGCRHTVSRGPAPAPNLVEKFHERWGGAAEASLGGRGWTMRARIDSLVAWGERTIRAGSQPGEGEKLSAGQSGESCSWMLVDARTARPQSTLAPLNIQPQSPHHHRHNHPASPPPVCRMHMHNPDRASCELSIADSQYYPYERGPIAAPRHVA